MPKIVRVYACFSWDATLGTWDRSKYRYTLDEIAAHANSKPIMDDYADELRPTDDEIRANMTDAMFRHAD